ncbi:MAG: 30S ribosomal protein S9 [Candidatus Brocadiia bacterium]|nr:30S ribosomal protein S9 [Candidatus Brocadiia bacterium]
MASDYWWGTGRRKTSVARVRIRPGTGVIQINAREFEEYFPRVIHRAQVLRPLKVADSLEKYDVIVRVGGGGLTGHAGAICLGIARALLKADSAAAAPLREHKLLTRDPRMVERKKFGLHKARRAHQFSKR